MEGDVLTNWRIMGAGDISIHSLRMEGDPKPPTQSESQKISIHSLRMEGDDTPQEECLERLHFNPLPPHGGRRRVV